MSDELKQRFGRLVSIYALEQKWEETDERLEALVTCVNLLCREHIIEFIKGDVSDERSLYDDEYLFLAIVATQIHSQPHESVENIITDAKAWILRQVWSSHFVHEIIDDITRRDRYSFEELAEHYLPTVSNHLKVRIKR
jgi:hypothetical protein